LLPARVPMSTDFDSGLMSFNFRKQITARRAYTERRKTLVVSMIFALDLAIALVVLIAG